MRHLLLATLLVAMTGYGPDTKPEDQPTATAETASQEEQPTAPAETASQEDQPTTPEKTTTLKGHTFPVTSVSFSPDGTRIASGSGDKTIRLWDASTGEELHTLKGHKHFVSSVSFSPDGKRIAAGGDSTIRLWDVATGEELHAFKFKGHTFAVTSVSFSPDGKRIASGSEYGTIMLRDASTGEELRTLKGHTRDVSSLSFSPDGTCIASGSRDSTIRLWDVATGEELHTFKGHKHFVSSVSFSPDGKRIASGSEDGTIKLWDASTGEELRALKGHTGNVASVSFSPDGTRIASGSEDSTIRLWDIDSMKMTSVAVEPQDTSRKEDDAPEAVTAKAGDTENTRQWYEHFVISQDNQRALQSGTIKAREVVTIDLEAKKKRHIGFGTNVFQDRIRFKDGETIIFHQTKGAVAGIGVTSTDGNGGGQEFTPVDGQLCFQLENNSNHTLKYVIYEVVENKEAVPHPTSTNSTASQSQTQDSVPVVNSIGMRFVPIPAGTFTRGQGGSAHKVTLTQAFHFGQYEVTQEQYKQVMGSNPSGFKEATRPVETVNWNEAVEFCRKLSAMPQEKSAGFVYRLPTDAEWEYASRAGTTTGFSFGDASAEMGNYGWLTSNSQETTHPVGQKKPNPWGLYDMYGNVWEWCLDWDGRRSSGSSVPVTDPTGPASGSLRVFRGGGWKSSPRNCRPDNRGKLAEVYRGNTLGFRVLLSSIK